jgi:L-ribulose-5-phosphate 4-epimerase
VAEAYESNTGRVIIERFKEIEAVAVPGVLVAGHAPFAWGKDAAESVKNAVALEAVAQLALGTISLVASPPLLEDYVLEKHYQRKHGPGAYYGQKSSY